MTYRVYLIATTAGAWYGKALSVFFYSIPRFLIVTVNMEGKEKICSIFLAAEWCVSYNRHIGELLFALRMRSSGTNILSASELATTMAD